MGKGDYSLLLTYCTAASFCGISFRFPWVRIGWSISRRYSQPRDCGKVQERVGMETQVKHGAPGYRGKGYYLQVETYSKSSR